jgi:hypothetical protein
VGGLRCVVDHCCYVIIRFGQRHRLVGAWPLAGLRLLRRRGRATGGVLFVRQSAVGGFKRDVVRAKYDPAHLNGEVVRENIVRYWKLGQLLRLRSKTHEWPVVIAGLAGPTKRRYVTGALQLLWEDGYP